MIVLILLFHLVLLGVTRFTAWPEVFSYPYLFNHGFLIYKDIAHVYQPLLTLTLSLIFKIFGYKLITLKIFTWSIILINDVLIYKILKSYIVNHKSILISVFLYALAQTVFEGNMLWFDLAMTPLLLGLVYLVLFTGKSVKQFFLMGVLLALCVLVKQQAVLVALPLGILLLSRKTTLWQWLIFLGGGLLPITVNLAWLMHGGVVKDYLFWSFMFPLYWLPQFSSYPIFPTMGQWIIIFLIFIPAFLVVKQKPFLVSMFIFLVVMAFPRFSYFHLQPALPIYIIIVATLLSVPRLRLIVLLTVMGTVGLLINTVGSGNLAFARFYDQSDLNLANLISQTTSSNDKIYLLGPQSLLYVLANRVPPKPWIDNYVWHFEIPRVQQTQILAWENDPPAFIFRTPPQIGAWDQLGVYQPQLILNYLYSHYNKISQTPEGIEIWRRL